MALLETTIEQETAFRTLDEVRQDYCITDADTNILLDNFEDVPGRLVLEVGSHDESSDAASIIAKSGQRVVGIDLRQPNHAEAGIAYEYLQADFCDLPAEFIREHIGKVDAIFSISAIEHFGLGAYGEARLMNYDMFAMRQMWQLLRPGGKAYITVPYGAKFQVFYPHWYVYNYIAVGERLVGDFHVEGTCLFTSASAIINGAEIPPNRIVSREDADTYDDAQYPHVTVFLKLVKQPVNRVQ